MSCHSCQEYSYFKQDIKKCTKIKDISCIYKVLGAFERALKSHYVSAPATLVGENPIDPDQDFEVQD